MTRGLHDPDHRGPHRGELGGRWRADRFDDLRPGWRGGGADGAQAGLGVDRGMMAGHIAIPIFSRERELLAYAGRDTGTSAVVYTLNHPPHFDILAKTLNAQEKTTSLFENLYLWHVHVDIPISPPNLLPLLAV